MNSCKSMPLVMMSALVACGLLISSPLSADPPENSGPHVYRFENFNWFQINANGMVGFVGANVEEICAGGSVDIWQAKRIENPSDFGVIMSQWKGDDVATFIYPEAAVVYDAYGNIDVPQLCSYHFTYGEVASGTSDAIFNDNDVFAWAVYHSRANSFNFSAHGVLFTPSDDPVRFSGGIHCVWKNNPDPDKIWMRCKDQMKLGQ